MSIYGRVEIEYYQITPVGTQRIQSGQTSHLGNAERQILGEIAKLGGTAEADELKTFGSFDAPNALNVALRRLVDLGLISPVSMQPQQVR